MKSHNQEEIMVKTVDLVVVQGVMKGKTLLSLAFKVNQRCY